MYCRLLPTLSSNNLVARCLWSVVRLMWPQIPAQCHHAMLTACDGTSYCSANPTAVERPSSASWNLHVIVQSYDHVGSVVICSFKCGWFTRPTRRVPALQITLSFDLVRSALSHCPIQSAPTSLNRLVKIGTCQHKHVRLFAFQHIWCVIILRFSPNWCVK